MANIKQAFEYAAANPNSEFANNLKQLAASGSLDQEAQKYGIDLSVFKAPKTEPTLGDKLKQRAENVGSSIVEQADKLSNTNSPVEAIKAVGRGVLRPAGDIAGAGLDIVNAGLTATDNLTGNIVSSGAKAGITAILNTPQGQEGLSKAQSGVESYNTWKSANPDAAKDLEAVVNIANIIPVGKVAGTVAKGVVETVPKVAKNVAKVANETTNLIPEVKGQAIAESLMNKVARVTPKEAQDFNKITGKSIGQYLAETGNFEAPDKIIVNEAKKFAQAKEAKDTALASLPGNFKDGALSDAIEELLVKAEKTSGKNVKSPYLAKVSELKSKLDTEGLTMAEINELKRLYESQVKLGYNKTLNPDLVERATNIDKEIVKFQDKTAKNLGFSNLPELNKQIQASKFIADKLGSSVIKSELLNNVSLTDWVMLSGGNPANIAGLITKKLFSSKNVQAKLAKTIAKKVSPKEIKAVIKN